MNNDVKNYVALKKEELKKRIGENKVSLCVIQVGDHPASNSYIKGKKKDCEEVGIKSEHLQFEECMSTEGLIAIIDLLNTSKAIDGIIVQLPLPPHIDVKKVRLAIDPSKDVDGFHPMSHFKPCTPMGVINFMKHLGYSFERRNALVIGRSDIVGKPLQELLTDLDCTVTLAHSKTFGIRRFMQESHIVFTAINRIEWFDISFADHLKDADCVIDIGLGVSPYDNKLHGNLSEKCVERLKHLKVPVLSGTGGVGLLTRLQLLENTVQASGL